ncbi:hypothetical protein EJ08DRAFT_325595 [Tothia fuscella]|uniref:Uncharacterized protein n=1 Tax=Tothia fuscella TaxID=1048955 RepID=A0A9P4NN96_9PEZI|nr:hypothetical protein EJ08DRAFT_325595 [Tothia fuscella]
MPIPPDLRLADQEHYKAWYEHTHRQNAEWNALAKKVFDICGCDICLYRREQSNENFQIAREADRLLLKSKQKNIENRKHLQQKSDRSKAENEASSGTRKRIDEDHSESDTDLVISSFKCVKARNQGRTANAAWGEENIQMVPEEFGNRGAIEGCNRQCSQLPSDIRTPDDMAQDTLDEQQSFAKQRSGEFPLAMSTFTHYRIRVNRWS